MDTDKLWVPINFLRTNNAKNLYDIYAQKQKKQLYKWIITDLKSIKNRILSLFSWACKFKRYLQVLDRTCGSGCQFLTTLDKCIAKSRNIECGQFCNLQIHHGSLVHTLPRLLWLPSVDRMFLNCGQNVKILVSTSPCWLEKFEKCLC